MNENVAVKFKDDKGEIAKDDFIKLGMENKLLDFGNAIGGEVIKPRSQGLKWLKTKEIFLLNLVGGPKKQGRSTSKSQGGNKVQKNSDHETNLLCCCTSFNLETGKIKE